MYTYFEDSNYVYLVVELCQNGELYRYLKTNAKVLSEDQGKLLSLNSSTSKMYELVKVTM